MASEPECRLEVVQLDVMARRIRRRIVEMSFKSEGANHLGGGLSLVEIMTVLYGKVAKFEVGNPRWKERDRVILSKGHGVLALFAALTDVGIIDESTLQTYKANGSDLIAHPVMNLDLGIESSNGSLGQGLSLGIGMAWGLRRRNHDSQVYVVLGDGECNEGSVWEAAMLAPQLKLENIVAIIDANGFQSDGRVEDVLGLGSLADKWKAFGWSVSEVDGHDLEALTRVLAGSKTVREPLCVVAHTVKGKGVPFMENNNDWHHNRLTRSNYERALEMFERES